MNRRINTSEHERFQRFVQRMILAAFVFVIICAVGVIALLAAGVYWLTRSATP